MSGAPDPRLAWLLRRWRRRVILTGSLHALALGLPLVALARIVPEPRLVRITILAGATALAMGLIASFSIVRARRVGLREVAHHLDRTLPPLQDSAELLLAAGPGLGVLPSIQRRRAADELGRAEHRDLLPRRAWTASVRWAAGSAAISILIATLMPPLPGWAGASTRPGPGASSTVEPAAVDRAAPIVRIRVEPPAYTGREPRRVEGLALRVEEGARLTWSVEGEGNIERGALVFDDGEIPLARTPAAAYEAVRVARSSELYFLRLEYEGGDVFHSAYARVETIRDLAPTLRWLRPEPAVELDAESPGAVELEIEAEDDYGLSQVKIVATLASGTGELVKFRERHLEFPAGQVASGTEVRLTRLLDPEALGMVPGAELYYYVEAEDNRQGEPNRSRSSAQRIIMPGGPGASVALPAGLPVMRLPEFFRSQRQIIVDTEKLLEDKDRISSAEFDRRSQQIGFDQRALRMRYGGLLGEEFVSGLPLGEDPDSPEEPDDEGSVSDASDAFPDLESLLLEGMVHQHDAAEAATFFTSRVRRTLKAALAEMWGAEGELRTLRPESALPYEYRALQLLKSAQESSRLYVQRIGFDPPPLYPEEKRLTGDLSEIRDLRARHRSEVGERPVDARRALEIVGALRRDPGARPEDLLQVLGPAHRAIARRASEATEADLAALSALRSLLAADAAPPAPEDLASVEGALWRLLPAPPPAPGRGGAAPGPLAELYRRRLGEAP